MNVEQDQPPLSQLVLASGAVISGTIITGNSALCLRSLWVQLVSKMVEQVWRCCPTTCNPRRKTLHYYCAFRGEKPDRCQTAEAEHFLCLSNPNFWSDTSRSCVRSLWAPNQLHLIQLKLGPSQSLLLIYRYVWRLFESTRCPKWLTKFGLYRRMPRNPRRKPRIIAHLMGRNQTTVKVQKLSLFFSNRAFSFTWYNFFNEFTKKIVCKTNARSPALMPTYWR